MIHTFSFFDTGTQQNSYYMLDVESGAIHKLDRVAFDVARALENGEAPMALQHPADTVREILGEFEELKEAGMFQSPEQPLPAQYADSGIIKSICLHVAHDCNLRCKYCFAETGEFKGDRMLMPASIGKAALDFLIAHSGARRNLEVDLFGGEPLMNFEAIQEIVRYGRELMQRHDKEIHFTITTNGLLLDEEKIAFINREMKNVVLSLDGRKHVHDALRPTSNGKGSFDAILPRIQALVRARGDQEHYIRGTYTANNLDFTEDVRAMYEMGFREISLEPVALEPSSPYAIKEEHMPTIEREYDRLCAYVQDSKRRGEDFRFFHFMIDLEDGPCLQKRLKGCGAGSEYAAVTPNGDIYPCHQFAGEEAFKLGNVLEEGMQKGIREQFYACTMRTKPSCRACWAKYFCSGGCAANAWKSNGDIYKPDELACRMIKKRTECALGLAMQEKEGV